MPHIDTEALTRHILTGARDITDLNADELRALVQLLEQSDNDAATLDDTLPGITDELYGVSLSLYELERDLIGTKEDHEKLNNLIDKLASVNESLDALAR